MGGLKTGSFVRRSRIPGLNVACQFCGRVLETAGHLFGECVKLAPVRAKLLAFAQVLGVVPSDGRLFFCTGFAHETTGPTICTSLFSMVAEVLGVLWQSRNHVLFRGGAVDALLKGINLTATIVERRRVEFFGDSVQDE